MKLIIAGSRNLNFSIIYIQSRLDELGLNPTEVVCGGADGVDYSGKDWANINSVPVKLFPSDWNKHGKKAGPIRNGEMAEYGDALLLIWDGQSRGSFSMKSKMQALNKPIYEIIVKA